MLQYFFVYFLFDKFKFTIICIQFSPVIFLPTVSEKCCLAQSSKYVLNGHVRKKMDPEQYLEKLMDYQNEDNKPLNLITVSSTLPMSYTPDEQLQRLYCKIVQDSCK